MRDWGIEQKWMSILLPLLLLYNGKFLFSLEDTFYLSLTHLEPIAPTQQTKAGVSQGCLLSSILFIILTDSISTCAQGEGGDRFQWSCILSLLFCG